MANWQQHIEQRPEVMMGKPVIKGTRITVELILQRLGDGESEEALLGSYPQITVEHIRAAQSYAASALSRDEMIFPREQAG